MLQWKCGEGAQALVSSSAPIYHPVIGLEHLYIGLEGILAAICSTASRSRPEPSFLRRPLHAGLYARAARAFGLLNHLAAKKPGVFRLATLCADASSLQLCCLQARIR